MITQLMDNLTLIFIVIPIFVTWLLYVSSYWISKIRWKSIHIAVQGSTIFYIIAVSILLENIIEQNLIGYIFIGLLIALSIILIVQWKINTEVILKKGLKVLARLSFLIFSTIYIALISYEIIQMVYLNYSQ